MLTYLFHGSVFIGAAICGAFVHNFLHPTKMFSIQVGHKLGHGLLDTVLGFLGHPDLRVLKI